MTDEQLRQVAHLVKPMLKPSERYAFIVIEESETEMSQAQCISTMPPSKLFAIVDTVRACEASKTANSKN